MLLVLIAAIGWPIFFAFKNVEANKCLIVERFGRFYRVCGPGWHFLMPFIDRGISVDLDQELPGWQGLMERELHEKLIKARYG